MCETGTYPKVNTYRTSLINDIGNNSDPNRAALLKMGNRKIRFDMERKM